MKVKFLATKRAKQNISVIHSEKKLKGQQVSWLERLDELVQSCERCRLFEGGRAKPYWTVQSKYAIIGESPWTDEIAENEPFVGATGELLWKRMKSIGLYKKDFVILNSVNCKPNTVSKKPTTVQVGLCKKWLTLYFTVVQPKKILVLGNYAMGAVTGDFSGITGKVGYIEKFGTFPAMLCVHPSFAMYNDELGEKLLMSGLKQFKAMR